MPFVKCTRLSPNQDPIWIDVEKVRLVAADSKCATLVTLIFQDDADEPVIVIETAQDVVDTIERLRKP